MRKGNLDNPDAEIPASELAGLPDSGQQAPLLILSIDDDPGMHEFYRAVLAHDGVRLESSTDPQQGVELAAALRPDLILLDLTMPEMDGLEALERIRRSDPEARVVMITGDYSIESAVKAVQAGATDYVCKPVSLEAAQDRQRRKGAGRLGAAREFSGRTTGGFVQPGGHDRPQSPHAGTLRSGSPRGAASAQRPDNRRDRCRQGIGGAKPAQAESPSSSAHRRVQLQRPRGHAGGEPVVRTSARSLYRGRKRSVRDF